MKPEDLEALREQAKEIMSGLGYVLSGPALEQAKAAMGASLERALSGGNPLFQAAQRAVRGEALWDAIADERYGEAERSEARAWLAEGKRLKRKYFVSEWTSIGTARFIEKLYAAGAVKVWIVAPQRAGDGNETSDVVIAVLPDEPEKRLALAAIHQKLMAKVWCSEPDEAVHPPKGNSLLFEFT